MSSVKQLPAKTTVGVVDTAGYGPEMRHAERDRVFFQGFLKIMIAIATLGFSVTFSFILTDIHPPKSSCFANDQLVFFLAMSWLLYTVTFAFACLVSLFLNLWEYKAMAEIYTESKWYWAGFGVTVLLCMSLEGAFMFISLVIMAYEFYIGIIGVCLAGGMWILCLVIGIFRLIVYLRYIKRCRESSNVV